LRAAALSLPSAPVVFGLDSHCGRPGVGVAGGPALVLRRRDPAALSAIGTAVRSQPAAAVASRRRPARARESGLPLLAALGSGGVLALGAAHTCSSVARDHFCVVEFKLTA